MSERILGEFVGDDRERYVVTTKFTNTIPSMLNPEVRDHPNAGGNHKKSMVQSVEKQPEAPEYRLHRPVVDSLLGLRDRH